jgi:hypothetical protein
LHRDATGFAADPEFVDAGARIFYVDALGTLFHIPTYGHWADCCGWGWDGGGRLGLTQAQTGTKQGQDE